MYEIRYGKSSNLKSLFRNPESINYATVYPFHSSLNCIRQLKFKGVN